MWVLRKFYGGNGGCLPPTDKRVLSMTPEQIDLEFMHMIIDKRASDKASGEVSYEDSDYENYDTKTTEDDSRLSDIPTFGSEVDPHHHEEKESDWEDVEIDE